MTNLATNPLLEIQTAIPFSEIRAEHIEPAVTSLLARAREEVEQLRRTEPPLSYDNVLAPLDQLGETLEYAVTVVGHLESVATVEAQRAAYNAILPEVSRFDSQLGMDPDLAQLVRDYAATEEAQSLTGPRRRMLEQTLDAFRRAGAELPEAEKQALEEINHQLSTLTTRFAEHTIDARAAFEQVVTDEARLAGLPESAVAAARADAERRGQAGWRFTLDAPSLIPVMTYADDRDLRRALYMGNATLATEDPYSNVDLIPKIIALRQEKAALLGYRDFADYVAEDRMAKEGARIRTFLEDLERRCRPGFEQDHAELLAFVTELGVHEPLEPWDVPYYAEKLRQQRYDFDREKVRAYFELGNVLDGMFELVSRLFGITVEELVPGDASRPDVWREDVRYFRILDVDGTHLGGFYVDLFPHDAKRGGAWMNGLITGGPEADGFAPHIGLICGNMTPPVGGRPALLTHDEVETVFHEFGHLLHHLLSKVEIKSLSGTNVAWDFVELPSQIMENWCWEYDALALFARHYETGEVLPQALFEKMLAARNFRSATAMMRQLGLGTLDLDLHTRFDPEKDDLLPFARQTYQRFTPVSLPDNYAMVCGFGHLFSGSVGYAAGYYSYKWAEVLDADAFGRFLDNGIFDRTTGRAYVDEILAKGDSADPEELFRNFMGRDPDPDALLRRAGLLR